MNKQTLTVKCGLLLSVLFLVLGFVSCSGDENATTAASDIKDANDATPATQTIPGFKYVKEETFSCGGQTNTVKIYRHDRTGLEFVLIPGGDFQMGSNSGDDDGKPVHTVNIKTFLICQTEVTQEAWDRGGGG